MQILMKIISETSPIFWSVFKIQQGNCRILITFKVQSHGYIVIHRVFSQTINAQNGHKLIFKSMTFMLQPTIWLLLHVLNAMYVCEICEIKYVKS